MRRFLPALALFVSLGAGGVAAPAETTERASNFGAITVVEEVRTRDPGAPPVMHVATEWTRLHLRWQTQDRRLSVTLRDDGEMLDIDVSAGDCLLFARYQRFEPAKGEPALWRSMIAAVRTQLQRCAGIKPSAATSYQAEMRRADSDFALAVEAMKDRSRVVFGPNLKRCRPFCHKPGQPAFFEPFQNRCDGRW
ncbi:hypothetical protein ACG3SL_14380 [Sphingomonas sp. CJ20]